MKNVNIELQSRFKCVAFWLGLGGVAVQSVLGVLIATQSISNDVAGSIIAGIAAIEAYCVGRNPSIKNICKK